MRVRDLWRIVGLAAGITACGGLALGACMAKRAEPKGASPTPAPDTSATGSSITSKDKRPVNRPSGVGPAAADAGTAGGPTTPVNKPTPGKTVPKNNKGMLGQMRLEGGE